MAALVALRDRRDGVRRGRPATDPFAGRVHGRGQPRLHGGAPAQSESRAGPALAFARQLSARPLPHPDLVLSRLAADVARAAVLLAVRNHRDRPAADACVVRTRRARRDVRVSRTQRIQALAGRARLRRARDRSVVLLRIPYPELHHPGADCLAVPLPLRANPQCTRCSEASALAVRGRTLVRLRGRRLLHLRVLPAGARIRIALVRRGTPHARRMDRTRRRTRAGRHRLSTGLLARRSRARRIRARLGTTSSKRSGRSMRSADSTTSVRAWRTRGTWSTPCSATGITTR